MDATSPKDGKAKYKTRRWVTINWVLPVALRHSSVSSSNKRGQVVLRFLDADSRGGSNADG